MRETWRWFGPQDEISVSEIGQTGAQGIVTALHHIPPGRVWEVDEIRKRQSEVETPEGRPSGLTWDVVESLPVSEAIKTQAPQMAEHVAAFRQSLHNLAACGHSVICYNFMPVIDWTRTALAAPLANGGTAMAFDLVDFAAFDIHILARDGAQHDYTPSLCAEAAERFASMDDAARTALVDNVVAGLPGAAEHWSLQDVRDCLATYAGISADRLRANLVDFLSEVIPTAESLGMRLCCHPDDPPFPLLGLPRVVSSLDDYVHFIEAVDSPANGVTFCTGSLGVAPEFDPGRFVARLGPKIHFAHLRNTSRVGAPDGARHSFYEAAHLEGDTDMVAAVQALCSEEVRRVTEGRADWEIPMRADHGHSILSDLSRSVMPGYPLIGRLKGLAELRGIEMALSVDR